MMFNLEKLVPIARLVLDAYKQFRLRFVAMVILGILSGLTAGLGIASVVPLFFVMTEKPVEEADYISQTISQVFSFLHIPLTPPYLLSLIVTLFILKALINFLAAYIGGQNVAVYEEKARREIWHSTLQTSWSKLSDQKIGYLENVAMYDIQQVGLILGQVNSIILNVTSFAMYGIIAFSISPPTTLATLSIGIITFLIFKPVFYKSRKLMEQVAATQKDITHFLSENILGMKQIKSFSVEQQALDIGSKYFQKLREAKITGGLYRYATNTFIEPAGFIFIAILFLFAYKTPGFNIASFAVVMYMVQKMFGFTQSTQKQIHLVIEQLPFLEAVINFQKIATDNQEKDSGKSGFEFNKSLEFRNVSFSYNSKRLLFNIALEIQRGQTVGLIGPSGSGKTTMVDLILRLLDAREGDILIDDKSIRSIKLKDWRQNIGYVTQDIFLLNDTVENNIKFFDSTINHEDIVAAAKMANIYDSIMELPDKFQTLVGERGIKFSGGQRQRISLARALARKPQILILDEATSSIDNESETMIQQSIQSLHGQITIISIAHRLSTVMNSDKLVVLEDGVITEEGEPDQLLKNKDSYLLRVMNVNTEAINKA